MSREGRGGGGRGRDETEPLLGDLEQGSPTSKKSWLTLLPQVLSYTWPDKWYLKLRLLGCFTVLLVARCLNVAVPLLYARAISQLSEVHQKTEAGGHVTFLQALLPWTALYLGFNVLRGGQGRGFLNALVNVVWYPVQQRSYMRVTMDTFDHILNLDLEYHLTRNTGTSLKVISRGASAIQTITTTILFTVGPQAIDIVSATAVVWSQLSGWISFIIFLTSGVYIPLTVVLTELRMKNRREVNEKDNVMSGKMADALINYDTVKYFTNEKVESDSFRAATDEYLTADYSWTKVNAGINVVMSVVMATGLTSGTLLVVANVADGKMGVGEVVLFISMLNQLAQPLNSFGSSYRTFQKAFIDVENVFEILERESEVKDGPNAKQLVVSRGDVSLKDVQFSYTRGTPILKGISLDIPAGQKVALVGETGSGKSTILRLLFRFYDPKSGSICVDGTDIKTVTLHSLRKAIGVVPQDCVLFNGSIRDNIAYGGGPDTTEEEIRQAAEDAQIHSHVVSRFPTGYGTVVGERGVRLSGGEKQRIGIARTLVKNPKILLLDEATSALDTITEKAIQAELDQVSSGRTTIVVAHRLSTVIDSNVIVLLHHGEIMEKGTHSELLAKGGRYADLWNRQLDINGATDAPKAEEAPVAQPRAARSGRGRGNRGG